MFNKTKNELEDRKSFPMYQLKSVLSFEIEIENPISNKEYPMMKTRQNKQQEHNGK